MASDTNEQFTDRGRWQRLLYVILFVAIYQVTEIVVGLTVLVQFIFYLITGRTLEQLRELGDSLGTFIRQIVLYVTFASNERPFPFAPFPRAGAPAAPSWDEARPESEIGPDE